MQIAFKLWINRDSYKFIFISFCRYIYFSFSHFYLYFIDIWCGAAALQLFTLDWHLIAFQRTAVIFASRRGLITIHSRFPKVMRI